MKDDRLYLIHILESITRVEHFIAGGKAAFEDDEKTQYAVIYALQTLGESAKNLSDSLKRDNPDVPWREIGDFRNILVHEYLNVNIGRVWQVVEHDVPHLKTAISRILDSRGGAPCRT